MAQIVGLLLLLICSCLAENEYTDLSNVDPGFCDQDICTDASKLVSILKGPVYQLGNFEDCLYRRKQQYCLANIQLYSGDNPSGFWSHIQNVTAVRTHFRRDILYVGICAPESSTTEDIAMDMADMLEPAAASLGIRAAIKMEQRNCQTRHPTPITTGDVVFGVVLLTIVTAVIMGTLYDSGFCKKNEYNRQVNTAQKFLLCFSLIKNWKKTEACKTSRNLASIEGIRVIFTFITVLVHHGYFIVINAVANIEWIEEAYNSHYKVLLIHAHIHICFFVCLSGFLTGYNASRQMDKGGFSFLRYIKMVVHRFLRYIPIYIMLVAFSSTWLNYCGSGPFWPSLVTSEVQNCRQNWWINVLFLNNYISGDTQCMLHTWYIAADFQNYVVYLFVLMMFYKYQKWSTVIAVFLFCTFIIIPFLQTYTERLDPAFLCIPETVRHMKENLTFKRSYIPFHGNAASYFVGVIFGCMFYKMVKEGSTLSKAALTVVWISSLVLPAGTMFTFYELYQSEYNILTVSMYAALHKPLYALGFAALLLGFCMGHGWVFVDFLSCKPFQTIAPFTYGIYLIHFILQRISAGNVNEPVTVGISYFISSAVMDFLIALLLSAVLQLCVHLPFENLFELNSGAEMLDKKHYLSVFTADFKKFVQKVLRYK